MRRPATAAIVAALCVVGAALPGTADAGQFTVHLCQQRDRTQAGHDLAVAQTSAAIADVSQDCGASGSGLLVTPSLATGMPADTTASVSLQPAGGGRITRLLLWHHGTLGAAGLSLALQAFGTVDAPVLASTDVPGDEMGGADQADIGPLATVEDFSAAPVNRVDYLLHCAGPGPCAGGPAAAAMRLYGAELTIEDATPPTVDTVTTPPTATGTISTVVRSSDGVSGVQSVRLLAAGKVVATQTLACDFRQMRPCPGAQDVALTWDSAQVPDGAHTLFVQVVDAAGTVTQTGRGIRTDNAPPVSYLPPAVSFTKLGVAVPVTIVPAQWIDPVTSVTPQWQRCPSLDLSTCTDIAGATDTTYVPTGADSGRRLRVRVDATDGGGRSSVYSGLTPVVPEVRPEIVTEPELSGTDRSKPRIGDILHISRGTWTEPVTRYEYQWRRCTDACRDVEGATAASYVVTPADFGAALHVIVKATDADDVPNTTEVVTGVVREATLINVLKPEIAGDVAVGKELEATAGAWSGDFVNGGDVPALSWRWLRCRAGGCRRIPGATAPTYRVSRADVRHTLQVKVTAIDVRKTKETAIADPVGPIDGSPAARRFLPRPHIGLTDAITGVRGRAVHRISRIDVTHLLPASTVTLACPSACRSLVLDRTRSRGTSADLQFPAKQVFAEGDRFDVVVTHAGRIGRVWEFVAHGQNLIGRLLCQTADGRRRACARQ